MLGQAVLSVIRQVLADRDVRMAGPRSRPPIEMRLPSKVCFGL